MSTIGAHAAPSWRHQSLQSRDVDEHAAQLQGWQQRYDQLSAGAFVGRLEQLSVGPAQVFRECTSQALRQRCEVRPDAVWCGITARHDGSRIDGRLVGEHGVMVCGGAVPFELVSPAGHDILGVVVERKALLAHAQVLGVAIGTAALDARPWLQLSSATRHHAQARLCAVLALARGTDAVGAVSADTASDAWQRSLLDTVVALLEQPGEPAVSRCNATARRRVVRQVHEWIEANPALVPSVPQLCARLNVSRRTLQYAFEAETAMSPVAYLRSIRLNGARRALRSGVSQSVREVAAEWGFWNLSQFGSDYRHQFGERPSDTLRGAADVNRRETAGSSP